MIEIRRYESDLLLSNMYVVVEGKHAVVIDPNKDVSVAEDLIIDKIILTHEHYDHIFGVNCWKKAREISVFSSKTCAENCKDPRKNLAKYFKEFCELQTWIHLKKTPEYDPLYSCSVDETFDDSTVLEWMDHKWCLFEMPGHSMGSIGVILDDRYFFSGDSLIENHEIELRGPGGSKKKWRDIGLPRLKKLPCGIQVFPGHFNSFVYTRRDDND